MASNRLVKQRQMTIFVTSRIWYSNHFHDGKSKFYYSIRLSATAAAAVVIACIVHAAAAVGRERDLLGRLNNIRGLRALVAELADKVLILALLRSCQTQSLVLIAQRLHLFVAHVVDNAVAQLVDCLQGVAVVRLRIEAVLHIHLFCVAEAIGNLLRQVPAGALNANVNILNCRPGIAAAGRPSHRGVN